MLAVDAAVNGGDAVAGLAVGDLRNFPSAVGAGGDDATYSRRKTPNNIT